MTFEEAKEAAKKQADKTGLVQYVIRYKWSWPRWWPFKKTDYQFVTEYYFDKYNKWPAIWSTDGKIRPEVRLSFWAKALRFLTTWNFNEL